MNFKVDGRHFCEPNISTNTTSLFDANVFRTNMLKIKFDCQAKLNNKYITQSI